MKPNTSTLALFAAYAGTVVAANLAITHIGMLPVWPGILAPSGVYLVGLALVLRDLLQNATNWKWSLGAVMIGAALSGLFSPALALASAAAFLLSQVADLIVYTPLRKRGLVLAVAVSSVAGIIADSVLFLYLAFGSLEFLAGQVLGKAWMTIAAILVLIAIRELRGRRADKAEVAR